MNLSIGCCMSADCQDRHCPGVQIATELQQRCSTCVDGPCAAPQACGIAEVKPINRRLFATRRPVLRLPETREEWGRAVGFGLGLAGFAFIAGAVLRHLQVI